MKEISEEMINIFHNNLESAQEANRQQKAVVNRIKLPTKLKILEDIKELREKGFEPQTILETIENKLKFDK